MLEFRERESLPRAGPPVENQARWHFYGRTGNAKGQRTGTYIDANGSHSGAQNSARTGSPQGNRARRGLTTEFQFPSHRLEFPRRAGQHRRAARPCHGSRGRTRNSRYGNTRPTNGAHLIPCHAGRGHTRNSRRGGTRPTSGAPRTIGRGASRKGHAVRLTRREPIPLHPLPSLGWPNIFLLPHGHYCGHIAKTRGPETRHWQRRQPGTKRQERQTTAATPKQHDPATATSPYGQRGRSDDSLAPHDPPSLSHSTSHDTAPLAALARRPAHSARLLTTERPAIFYRKTPCATTRPAMYNYDNDIVTFHDHGSGNF